MLTIAQTNLQLYNQLRRADWSGAELARARAAYELGMSLFSGQYRANGKPFLAHLVGTASILATFRQSPEVVVAGLIHAAFEFGDFGDGAQGITPWRVQRLTSGVDAEVADLIRQYQNVDRAAALRHMLEPASARDSSCHRGVLLMHLADSIEAYADGGINYAPSKRAFLQNAGHADVSQQLLAALRTLGLAAFVPNIQALLAHVEADRLPPELISQAPGSHTIAPASSMERPMLRWSRRWQRLRRRWNRLLSPSVNVSGVSPTTSRRAAA